MMTRFGLSKLAMVCRPCDSLQLGEILSSFAPLKMRFNRLIGFNGILILDKSV
jgi:hypothetical protein